ncbi:MAG: ABC transporter substrate-binding protein [Coriobacteriales bacterium]|jgi:iron complex transport system substrate-binding protein|nr:ABC transporter substrate-binding protein [Coriobacteriales bacterium]
MMFVEKDTPLEARAAALPAAKAPAPVEAPVPPTPALSSGFCQANTLSRRAFVRLAAGLGLAAAGGSGIIAALGGCAAGTAGRTLTDMGGREVHLPETVSRVLCTNPIGTVDVYLLDPSLLVGWNFKPQAADAAFLDPATLELPSLGVWMGAGSVPNAEEVLSARPDALLCFWSTDAAGVAMADSIQEEMRLPVVLCDCNLERVVETYRFLGELLGAGTGAAGTDGQPGAPAPAASGATSAAPAAAASAAVAGTATPAALTQRLETLTAFFAEKLELIRSTVARIPQEELRTVFLAEGKGGLQTDPVGSLHVQDALDLLHTLNVVDLPGSEGQGMGMPSVSIEQIITWNPSAVLVSEYSMSDTAKSDLYNEIRADRNWNTVSAVAAGEVYQIPQSPFSWFGRPPSALRLLGCLWLLCCLYPQRAEAAGIKLESEVREFFSLCFSRELTEAEIAALLKQ